ncbi:MAG: hypothetical protein J4473_05460 [Candidatus Aenigmarchaeota archaeon]|nr:hypothetical protein [Candidatus Aenigmarchaeota archaeon]
MVSIAIVIAASIVAITIVLNIGLPVVNTALNDYSIKKSAALMHVMDNYMEEVMNEESGSIRELDAVNDAGDIRINSETNSIEANLKIFTTDYGRFVKQGIMHIYGSDVFCDDTGNITMENSAVKIIFRKSVNSVDTSQIIINMTEKRSGDVISFTNSSVIIDSNESSVSGSGYTELLESGSNMPLCVLHAKINSTLSYDVFYTLYAGADFIEIRVENIT